ncbi:hypothetical protein ACFE6N_22995 [Pedobacter sp. BG31]|uniref:hypothetical protein n=1 Tax=Pedobacter sp. BG31 TaxID=3349697 RepID=UPI0035F297D2
MNRKKYILLVLLLISVISLSPFIVILKYGVGYNKERARLGIPSLGNEWERSSFSMSEINYTNPVSEEEKRYHLKKRIQIDWLMNIEKESDYFIIEDKGLAIDVIYNYKNRNPWYIRYFDKSNSKTILSHEQFLDTLRKYDIDIKY